MKKCLLKFMLSLGFAVIFFHPLLADTSKYEFNYGNNKTSVTNPLGGISKYDFVKNMGSYLNTKYSAGNYTINTEYDVNGFPEKVINPNGSTNTYSYDITGLIQEQTIANDSPSSIIITHKWTDFRLPDTINMASNDKEVTVSFQYDQHHQLLAINKENPINSDESLNWNYKYKNNLLSGSSLPINKGLFSKITYDAQGNISSYTNVLGQTIHYLGYNPDGFLLKETDLNQVESDFSYDAVNRLTNITQDGHATNYSYYPSGLLKSIILADKTTDNFTYDVQRNIASICNPAGQCIKFLHNALNELTQVDYFDSAGHATYQHHYVYDSYGKLIKSIDGKGNKTQYTYDKTNQLSTALDAESNNIVYQYDPFGYPLSYTKNNGKTLKYGHDPFGDLTSYSDYRGIKTSYTYDSLNRLISINSPDTGLTNYVYNKAGEVSNITDADKRTQSFVYDPLGRISKIDYSDASNAQFMYDQAKYGIGHITGTKSSWGTSTLFGYDADGNILSESDTASGKILTTNYTYNSADRISTIKYPDGLLVEYTYNQSGKINSIHFTPPSGQPLTIASNITYTPFGPFKSLTLGNNATIARTYDLNYNLTQQNLSGVMNEDYVYDELNQLTSVKDAINPSSNQNFNYNKLRELIAYQGSEDNFSYSYDDNGNRTTKKNKANNVSYGIATDNNHMTSISDGSPKGTISYDKSGDILSIGNQHFIYNPQHRLEKIINSDGSTISILYDSFGTKILTQYSNPTTKDSESTHYVSDKQGKLIELINIKNQSSKTIDFVYLYNMPIAEIMNGKIYYFITDQMGTPKYLIDNGRNKAWTANLSPFGSRVTTTNEINQPLRLAGQTAIDNSDIYSNHARDYIPSIGRYLQPDPLGIMSGNNVYAYAYNNPLFYEDPTGMYSYAQFGSDFNHYVSTSGWELTHGLTVNWILGSLNAFGGEGATIDRGLGFMLEYANAARNPLVRNTAEKIAKDTQAASDKVCSIPYLKSRPGYAKNQIEQVWNNAASGHPLGKVFDRNTGEELSWDRDLPRNGQWDMGHRRGMEYRSLHQDYVDGQISKEQFLDKYRDPAKYRPESPSANRSRRYEQA